MKTEIMKNEKDTFVGTFQKSRNFGFVVADDRDMKEDIYIPKKNRMKARNRQKVVVKITKWPQKGKKAEGKIIEILGYEDEAGVDMLSLVKDYQLPYEFPEPVICEAKKISQEIEKQEIPYRLDFRKKEIFTIDGEDAKDLDDAVAVEKLKDGNYLLNVSIADVSHYVKESSLLDQEAILRGTSIYLIDRVIPMLPKELSNGICSLNQGEDRLAITVLMEINNQGKVVSSDIQKSIINVTRRMSYKEVQTILNELHRKQDGMEREQFYTKQQKQNLLKECHSFFAHFQRMEELATILKERRAKAGSLELNVPESKITLNEVGKVVDVQKYQTYFAHEIIEQFMLTANETVAEKFYWLEAPFIYRVHEQPELEKVQELNQFLFNLGYRIKISADTIHPKAFAGVLEEVKGKPEERVVSNLILRTLKVARYEAENKGHFGIASKYYCHFTSPIRRYPDLFIHRVISNYLENNYQIKEEKQELLQGQAEKYARISSECERRATQVERDCDDMKKAEFMQEKIGQEYEGIISGITSFGMFVELENTVEGLIRFENLGEEYFIYDENKKTLLGEKTKTMYHIGDSIKIQVIGANKTFRRIDFAKVDVS